MFFILVVQQVGNPQQIHNFLCTTVNYLENPYRIDNENNDDSNK